MLDLPRGDVRDRSLPRGSLFCERQRSSILVATRIERGDNSAGLVCGGHRRLHSMQGTDYSPLEASTRASREGVLTCSRLSS